MIKKEFRVLAVFLVLLLCFAACDDGVGSESGGVTALEDATSVLVSTPDSSAQSSEKQIEYHFTDSRPIGDVKVLNFAFGQDLWPDYSAYPVLTLRVISKRPLNLEDFSLTMPIQTGYTASVEELPLQREPEADEGSGGEYPFPYYLYQIYEGTDWKSLAELARLAEETEDAMKAREYQTAYQNEMNRLYPAFQKLTERELPAFSLYEIRIRIPSSYEGNEIFNEECSRIELHLDDFDTVLEGKSFRIHKEPLPFKPLMDANGSPEGVKQRYFGSTTGERSYPWNDGYIQLPYLMWIEALENTVLTDLSLYQSSVEIDELQVKLFSEDSGSAKDFFWDGKSPLKVKAGESVLISARLHDPDAGTRLTETAEGVTASSSYGYSARVYAILQYQCDGREGSALVEENLSRVPDPWEAYAIWFDGIDVSSYYLDYYYPILDEWVTPSTEVGS